MLCQGSNWAFPCAGLTPVLSLQFLVGYNVYDTLNVLLDSVYQDFVENVSLLIRDTLLVPGRQLRGLVCMHSVLEAEHQSPKH